MLGAAGVFAEVARASLAKSSPLQRAGTGGLGLGLGRVLGGVVGIARRLDQDVARAHLLLEPGVAVLFLVELGVDLGLVLLDPGVELVRSWA